VRTSLDEFERLVVWDFEFRAPPGDLPHPVCAAFLELRTSRRIELWLDDRRGPIEPPFPMDNRTLWVGFMTSAEFGCHRMLGWGRPAATLDLFVEFRNLLNPLYRGKRDLLSAAEYFRIPGSTNDVDLTAKLLMRMHKHIDFSRALLRGVYMWAVSGFEQAGIPIDVQLYQALQDNWPGLYEHLIQEVNERFQVFDSDLKFRRERFARALLREGISRWPRTDKGALKSDDSTFRSMTPIYPILEPLRQGLPIGRDGYCRVVPFGVFRSKTGRNQPGAGFPFILPTWTRVLIQPKPGTGLAYIDWESQEAGIAAAIPSDEAMLADYQSGDIYMAFAIRTGAAPPWATRQTHEQVRNIFKVVALAVQYGQGARGLAERLGITTAEANELLALHRRVYPRFWRWSDAVVDHAFAKLRIQTCFGWTRRLDDPQERDRNPRSIRNALVQGNGAEMMRIAAIFLEERGIRVSAPVHDAFLCEYPLDEETEALRVAQQAMADASREVLREFALRTEVKVIRPPARYDFDPRQSELWSRVKRYLQVVEPGLEL
jgi:hypothetical protein